MAERQITRFDLIRFRAEPVTVIVWSPRLPLTKNQPPISVDITRPTASTTAAINDPERSRYIGRNSFFRNPRACAQYLNHCRLPIANCRFYVAELSCKLAIGNRQWLYSLSV